MSSGLLHTRPVVSAIIVNWNSKNHVVACLNSLQGEGFDTTIEIIVVDNNSSDGSKEEIGKQYPNVTLIANDSNLMFAGGVNSGLKIARGKYFLILNPDIIITPQAVFTLVNYLDAHPDVAAVSPQLCYPGGEIQTEYILQLPSLSQFIFFYSPISSISKKSRYLRKRFYEKQVVFDSETIVDQLPGACILVSREVVVKTGGMDEDFTLYYEDVDWCKRISLFGHLIVNTKINCLHYGGGSHEKHEYWIYGRFRVSMLLYFIKHLGKVKFTIAKWILFGYLYTAILLRLFQKILPFVQRNKNEYHLKKYKFFLMEFNNRKQAFAKY